MSATARKTDPKHQWDDAWQDAVQTRRFVRVAVKLHDAGRYAEALVATDRGIELERDDFWLHFIRAHVLYQLNRFGEALAAADRALGLEPDLGDAFAVRAEALLGLRRWYEALIAADSATELDPRLEKRMREDVKNVALAEIHKYRKLYESKNPSHNSEDMDAAAKIQAAAELLTSVYPAEDVRKTLEDLAAKAARETTTHAKAKPRPKWENRKGDDLKLSPPEFIAKHYAAEMAAGTLHRGVIAREDKPLAVKLASWLRSHPMPEGIDIPTKPEWNTRQLEKVGEPVSPGRRYIRTENASLYDAARYRSKLAM